MDIFLEFYYFWGFLGLLFIGFIFGRVAEAQHYKSIQRRERKMAHILVFSDRKVPAEFSSHVGLVMGSVVLSNDYFQKILAGLRAIFGGNIRVYESLLIRARREAVLRMKKAALDRGAKGIFNVKFETSTISGGGKTVTTIEVIAYGTAVKAKDRYEIHQS